MISTEKKEVEVRINDSDLSPIDRISPDLLENFSYQIALLIAKRLDSAIELKEAKDQMVKELNHYNIEHLEGVLTKAKILELTSAALTALAARKIHVGKNIEVGVIILSVKSW